MPIRPIDMQVLIPKAIKIDHAKPSVVNKAANALQTVQAEQEAQREIKQKKVNQLERREPTKVKRDLEQDQKKKKNNDADKKKKRNTAKHLDLKI
ncbi:MULTISPECIES: hypothetical protein [unclassified Fusibacter]|uniref:hypothetical protein n=1 Tax=unclassified Fusibacter TaxID=2624464 RepID=UPI001012E63A|nr:MULTISPECIES: hypothetical protein [unclassified Fusibacter]MCK8058787.1 hypothetical protein [Fusibacter sp. A2]NPE21861.1 hypothetical protein [Fusibacter sp. A1]RXV61433.1 hypothetical protein DWB64_08455 [Fusibacter sp. A1]